MTGALYGLLVAVVLVIGRVGGPIAWMFVWMVMSGQLAVSAAIVWKRTRLPLMTLAMMLAAFAGLVLGFVGRSHTGSRQLVEQHPYLIVGMVAAVPLMMFAEKWAHPAAWRQMKAHGERASLRDILAFRHIPDLRPKAEA